MDREEAIKILQEEIDGNLELTLREWQERDEQRLFPALRTAIEALSQPNYETDTEVRLAVTNRKKEKVILWDAYGEVEYYPIEALSTDAVQGVGRYENAMQKLRDMPRYLNGVKEKQITKISTNYTTEKPNGVVEQKNDVVAAPTDLISRAELLDRIKAINSIPWGDDRGNAVKLVWSTEEVKRLIEKAPSADRPSGEWIPCSERLPSKDGCYLVTTTGTNNDIIDIAYYTEEIWHKASRIKAWMPLPKPYCPNCGADMRGEKNE